MRRSVTLKGRKIVTLIGVGQAQVGSVFIHRGPGSKCGACEYSQVCVKNVEPERVYRIVRVREKTLPCRQYEMEMQVVEVLNAEIPAAILSKKAIIGAVVTFQTPDCKAEGCENFGLCFPAGLRDMDRCEVLGVTGNLKCPEGLALKAVSLRRVPAS